MTGFLLEINGGAVEAGILNEIRIERHPSTGNLSKKYHNTKKERRPWRGALLALIAYNAYNLCMQYTIRNVPNLLDAALRRSAREQGKSLNEVAIEALARGAGVSEHRSRRRDLRDIAGSWRKDPVFDSALAAQDTIDAELWR